MFAALEYVWRTNDSDGPQAYLDQRCNEQTGDFKSPCGDWVPLGSDSFRRTESEEAFLGPRCIHLFQVFHR